ncbi:unnamed protein product [Notodromas monacha]|uniref:G-protein-signaling modulator 2 n=1 Tax=Notodromas monacha TaxID=399045 RepID=A0A7R9GFK4_9CRUS|nr:unnamed protein product [Notodromas monacha]CAG0919433.1 unnamed protein product [Notodromas monacha]
MDNTTSLELALEGERLCKSGDCRAGVAFFEAAIQAGTDDLKTLSAVYSQLGNAYFYLGDYLKAMQYHKHDLTLARSMGDRLGEAKASGNLGNTLKVMGKFEEAILCCQRHLYISRQLDDKVGEGRALYNLGNVYHAQGKHLGRLGQQDPGDFPEEVRQCLQSAVNYYEDNLRLMTEISDRAAQGRACGNLGNTHYLLGNFTQAINYHQERLKIAKEFGDKSAERRAHSNLGNAHVFLGEFEVAAEHYRRTLWLAQELGDRAVEAQACYSLGNTYTLLKDYTTAIQFHLRHLKIAQELMDRVGEGRACWSLGNAHAAIGENQTALKYAQKHLEISKDIGDETGYATAQISVNELEKAVEDCSSVSGSTPLAVRRRSMENMDLLKMTPDTANGGPRTPNLKERSVTVDEGSGKMKLPPLRQIENGLSGNECTPGVHREEMKHNMSAGNFEDPEQEDFFELVSRFQSKRMDDQRCPIFEEPEDNMGSRASRLSDDSLMTAEDRAVAAVKEDLLEMIAGIQGKRLDEQRACLPGLNPSKDNEFIIKRLSIASSVGGSTSGKNFPDDGFFDQLMRCQGSRIEDQRCFLPGGNRVNGAAVTSENNRMQVLPPPPPKAPTVPDEDFFSLIMKLQSGRMEDQRSALPRNEDRRRSEGGSPGARAHDPDHPGREIEKSSSVPKLIKVTKK